MSLICCISQHLSYTRVAYCKEKGGSGTEYHVGETHRATLCDRADPSHPAPAPHARGDTPPSPLPRLDRRKHLRWQGACGRVHLLALADSLTGAGTEPEEIPRDYLRLGVLSGLDLRIVSSDADGRKDAYFTAHDTADAQVMRMLDHAYEYLEVPSYPMKRPSDY